MGPIEDVLSGGLRRRLLLFPIVAGLALGGAAPGFASTGRRATLAKRRPLAEARYRAGVDFYARGAYTEALVAFQDAVRLDPGDRAARAAANRVRSELGRHAATYSPGASVWRLRPEPPADRGEASVLAGLAQFVHFERTLGDSRNQQGAQQAMLGRVAQLLAERRMSRARGRPFAREKELHALARRLPAAQS